MDNRDENVTKFLNEQIKGNFESGKVYEWSSLIWYGFVFGEDHWFIGCRIFDILVSGQKAMRFVLYWIMECSKETGRKDMRNSGM